MRTTVTFADDVAALIQQRRREVGAGTSQVVNDLIRAGAAARRPPSVAPPLPTFDLGLAVDVRNVAEALALLEEHD